MRQHVDHNAELQSLSRLWWLEPAWLFGLVVGGTFLVAACQSDASFRLYGTPKFIAAKHIALAAGSIFVFAIGCAVAVRTGQVPKSTPRRANAIVRLMFWTTFVLTIVGYAAWLLVSIKNGLSVGMLREFISTDDPEVWETMNKEVFTSWKGVTTMTQFAVAALPLGLWLAMSGSRRALAATGVLMALAAVRAVVLSERLALIELVVPAAVIGLRTLVLGRPLARVQRLMLQAAPVLAVTVLLVLFGASEYLRSWRYYRHEFDSFSSFIVWRISGYYTTAHNNGALALETQAPYPVPYSTLRAVWLFPGLSKTPLSYASYTGIDPAERYGEMLERFATPELNNEGGLFQPALDYGPAGYLLFWLGCGFVSGRLYRHYLVGTLAGLTLYPLIVIAVMETPRFLYLCYTRSFPGLVALAAVLWLVHQRSSNRRMAPRAAIERTRYA
jgi:hypothetical protein